MSTVLDETAADVPVRDTTVSLSRLSAAPQDLYQNARVRQDLSRVSREELEDRFQCLQEETLQLKQHIHKQDDKIKKLGTKLMKLVKDRGRMEQLAAGGGPLASRVRDVEMEEMMEELQDKVRSLQAENEGLKQRLLLAKQQLISSQSRRPSPYRHVPSRVNSGLKKLRDSGSPPPRPKSNRSVEGGGRPQTGLLPRFGQSLLEEARAEIRNLENVVEEMEGAAELLQEELKKNKTEYEERLLEVRQQQTSNLRSHVSSNVSMIRLQQQLTDRSAAVTELQGRFTQLQESQRTLQTSHQAALVTVDELSARLKLERMKSLDLDKQLQSLSVTSRGLEQLQERIREVEQERDLLKESNDKLLLSAFDVSQQQKRLIPEQQLKLKIVQLETALKADHVDKNEILDKIKAERENNEKLREENQTLQVQFLQQKQQLEELHQRLKVYSRENEYDAAELTEALMLVKARRCQKNGDLDFLKEVEEGASGMRELRAAQAETVQELQKTRNLLSVESQICQDYKAELEAANRKMDGERVEYEKKLQRQRGLLDQRASKIHRLEAQLRDVAYGTKASVFKVDVPDEDQADGLDGTLHLERGENLLELQIVCATLSPAALEVLGDCEPSTFCTYSFYLFELHSTPVVTGHKASYGFTSKYVVNMDEHFLDYVHRGALTVELHQALGLDWRTLARGRVQLQPLLEADGKVHGSAPLVGVGDETVSLGSLDFWLRLRVPMTEATRLYQERLKAVGYVQTALNQDPQTTVSSNELHIAVQRCRGLQSRTCRQPSAYVVYKFSDFPDHPTATVQDCWDPDFKDLQSYSVSMDADLDQYLQSELLQFYVFDFKEERMDEYLGKAGVPLQPLTQNQQISGEFQLTGPSGLPAGHIQVTLRWKFRDVSSSGSTEPTLIPEEAASRSEEADLPETLQEDREREDAPSQAPPPKLRHTTRLRDAAAKKVSFQDAMQQVEERMTSSPVVQRVLTQSTKEEEEEDFSEGQLLPVGSFSDGPLLPVGSDDSETSEEITEDVDEAPADRSEWTQSDSDDCIVQGAAAGRKASERLRVEISSLSLRPESRVARDGSMVRLFVEYSLLDLPTEETPLSLPKPPGGRSLIYNYSKVVPVDAEKNAARRGLLRTVLQGRNPQMERIRFTVVSEPPEEEEQERECEDVGVAFLRIPEILEGQRDLMDTSLNVVDVDDSSELVGSLTVSVEGLEALQAIMEDQDQD